MAKGEGDMFKRFWGGGGQHRQNESHCGQASAVACRRVKDKEKKIVHMCNVRPCGKLCPVVVSERPPQNKKSRGLVCEFELKFEE